MLEIDPQAIVEILPLATEAIAIQQRAMEREAKHAVELKKKGIAEVPPCGSERYVIDTPAFGGFSFDDWGELYIDRRFVTDEEMKTIKKIEGVPYTDGHSVVIECHGGEVLFSSFGVDKAGVFGYDPSTEAVRHLMSSSVNIAYLHFFE